MKIIRLAVPALLFPGLFLAGCDAQKAGGQPVTPAAVEVAGVSSPIPQTIVLPSPVPLPAETLTDRELVFVNMVLPLVNNAFPYRTALKPDSQVPGAIGKPPTNQIVLKQVTGTGTDGKTANADPEKKARAFISSSLKDLIDESLVDSFFSKNETRFALPAGIYAGDFLLDYSKIDTELARHNQASLSSRLSWWESLAETHPRASVVAEVSAPVVSVSGTKAFMSVTVDTGKPDRMTYYYLFDKYDNQWFVSHSSVLH